MKNKALSQLDRDMTRELKHAKPSEIAEIKRAFAHKRKELLLNQPERESAKQIEVPSSIWSSFPASALLSSPVKWVQPFQVTWTLGTSGTPLDLDKLDSLKDAEAHKICRRAPDRIEVITAWRAWGLTAKDGEWRLRALGKMHIWQPREMMAAHCDQTENHPAPSRDCTCGIWSFKELDSLVQAISGRYSDIRVMGKVSLWGRVIETENGYRAQYAYPAELWLFDNSLEELGYIYDVPVRTTEK